MVLFFAIFSSFFLPTQVFPVSSELQIWKLRNFFDRAPKGILLTVGGDRAFKSAVLFEGIEHLIVVDNAIEMNHFNRINDELLKASNKEDCEASFEAKDIKASLGNQESTSKGQGQKGEKMLGEELIEMRHFGMPTLVPTTLDLI